MHAEKKPVFEVEGVSKYFSIGGTIFGGLRKAQVKAVDSVSFDLAEGETLGLVGESGCGKSTLGKTVLRLFRPTSGRIRLLGVDISDLAEGELRQHRRHMQMVFQDPYSSLNPRMRCSDIVTEPLEIYESLSRKELDRRVIDLFEQVGLRAEQRFRYPHQMSGGQRQRLNIARALALQPRIIVADEPVSALDVSVQAQVINLLSDLQRELNLALLFISHDLAVVEHISHRIAVMYLGRIVEHADKKSILGNPLHPYTESLLSAVPSPDPGARKDRIILEGDLPSPLNPPQGCAFHTRCPLAKAECRSATPQLREVEPNHYVACHLRQ